MRPYFDKSSKFCLKTLDPWKYLNLVFRIRKSHLCVHVISCELANSGSQRNYFHINYIRLHQPQIHISIILHVSHRVQILNHIIHLGYKNRRTSYRKWGAREWVRGGWGWRCSRFLWSTIFLSQCPSLLSVIQFQPEKKKGLIKTITAKKISKT